MTIAGESGNSAEGISKRICSPLWRSQVPTPQSDKPLESVSTDGAIPLKGESLRLDTERDAPFYFYFYKRVRFALFLYGMTLTLREVLHEANV